MFISGYPELMLFVDNHKDYLNNVKRFYERVSFRTVNIYEIYLNKLTDALSIIDKTATRKKTTSENIIFNSEKRTIYNAINENVNALIFLRKKIEEEDLKGLAEK